MKKLFFWLTAIFAIGQIVYPLVMEYIEKYHAQFPPEIEENTEDFEDNEQRTPVGVQVSSVGSANPQPVGAASNGIAPNEAF